MKMKMKMQTEVYLVIYRIRIYTRMFDTEFDGSAYALRTLPRFLLRSC
jgi:hypothetical protein